MFGEVEHEMWFSESCQKERTISSPDRSLRLFFLLIVVSFHYVREGCSANLKALPFLCTSQKL